MNDIPSHFSSASPSRLTVDQRASVAYLILITLAEIITTLVSAQLGMVVHGILLFLLLFHSSFGRRRTQGNFYLALSFACLIRLLSISLPLYSFPPIYRYLVIGTLLLPTALITARMIDLKPRTIGLTTRRLPLQLAFGLTGIGFGYVEYLILRPQPLVESFSWVEIFISGVILLIFTGFLEELVFRGLMQSTAAYVLGRYSLLYVSAVYAVLHMGHRSALNLTFVFLVALFFGWITIHTGSILGVSLSHGLTNITLFLVFPFVFSSFTPSSHHTSFATLPHYVHTSAIIVDTTRTLKLPILQPLQSAPVPGRFPIFVSLNAQAYLIDDSNNVLIVRSSGCYAPITLCSQPCFRPRCT